MLDTKIEHYTESFTSEESDSVKKLVSISENELEHTDMLSGRQVGTLLKLLLAISGAKRVLDIGTFTGYSALMMADAMPEDGELITCEMNEKYHDISDQFFSINPYKHIIKQVMGDALQTIPAMPGPFDLVFLDADKINYPAYYSLIKEKVQPGSLLVVDNTLWGGEVLDPNTSKAKAIHRTNLMIKEDPEIEQIMLPVRDGVLIGRFLSH